MGPNVLLIVTNNQSYRYSGLEHLDAIQGMYLYDPKVPGAAEAAAAKNLERNQRVADELRGLGIYPDGNINAYLRTHDVLLQEEEEPSEEPP